MIESIKGKLYPVAREKLGVIILEEKEFNGEQQPELSFDELLNADLDHILDEWLEEDSSLGDEENLLLEEEPAKPIKKKDEKKSTWQGTLLMYLHDLVYLLAGLILVFLLLFRVVVVSGTSMNSTLLDGDYLLLLSNTFYHNPQHGDIIVASKESFDNGAPIVKRVIATEGQVVDIDFVKGIVYVDGVELDEPYTLTPTTVSEGIEFPLTVAENCIFVMGDNRNGSKDSRHPEIGLVDKREVLGKVFFLFLPGTNEGKVPQDFDRIGVVN